MNHIKIEPYNEVYKGQVSQLILRIQQEEFNIPITLDMQPDLEKIPLFYQVNNGNFWVAKMDDTIIGTIALLDIGNNKAALRKMFVAKEYRGTAFGAGQALLDNLIDWAGHNDIQEILLGTTEKFIGAQRFYEKNGFVEIQKKYLPKAFPVMEVDVKFYSYMLKKHL